MTGKSWPNFSINISFNINKIKSMTKTRRHIIIINISFTYNNNIKNKNIPNITTVTIARWRYNYRWWETTKVFKKMMTIRWRPKWWWWWWWRPRWWLWWWWWYNGDDGHSHHLCNRGKELLDSSNLSGGKSRVKVSRMEEVDLSEFVDKLMFLTWSVHRFFKSTCDHVEKIGFLPSTNNKYDP